MTKQLNHVGTPADTDYATAYLVFELSKANWHLGVMLPGSTKMSRYTIAGGDTVKAFGAFGRYQGQVRAERQAGANTVVL